MYGVRMFVRVIAHARCMNKWKVKLLLLCQCSCYACCCISSNSKACCSVQPTAFITNLIR